MPASPSPADFRPAQQNPFLVWFVQTVSPAIARWRYQLNLDVDPQSLATLQSLRGKRQLLLPNHPTFQDPIVIFCLSAKLRQSFHYLAAYEQFRGVLGQFLQAVGVYSIRRGMADRPSIAYTLELMSQPDCRLVIFPEGGCSFQNDTVMPFRAGAVQLAFQALNRLAKRGEAIPDFYVVPVSIKYRYTQDMTQAIQVSLSNLEQALEIPTGTDTYGRLRAIAAQVLLNLEQEYGVAGADTSQQSWDDRIATLKLHVLRECEQRLAIAAAPTDPIRERVYRIQYALQTNDGLLEDTPPQVIPDNGGWTLATMQKAMFRILNFDAIYDGYVAANPTPERFIDTLTRLEREVFNIDQPPPKGHRQARLRTGDIINLKDWFADYQTNRSGTVDRLILQVQQTVQQNLDLLN